MAKSKYTKRPDGRYKSKVYLGKSNGKPEYKYVYARTVKELEEKVEQIKAKNNRGINIFELDSTLSEWIDRYNNIRKHTQTEKNYQVDFHRLEYFKSKIGKLKLKNVNQAVLQPIIYELYDFNPTTGKPTAKKTLTGYINALSRVFEFAIENRVTEFNPCKYLSIPKDAPKQQRRALTEEERRWIRETPHLMQLPCMLMLYAGLRRGEVCALTWSDIDFKEGTITINKSFDFYTGTVKAPKTEAGNRIIPMPQILSNFLLKQMHTSLNVVTNKGKPFSAAMWQYHWNEYMYVLNQIYGKKIEQPLGRKAIINQINNYITIDKFTPHCLRHTYCTNCIKSGIPVESVRMLLGHSDISTTIKVYTHLDIEAQKQSIKMLEQFIEKTV